MIASVNQFRDEKMVNLVKSVGDVSNRPHPPPGRESVLFGWLRNCRYSSRPRIDEYAYGTKP